MTACCLAVLLSAATTAPAAALPTVPSAARIHLGVTLQAADPAGRTAFGRALQDPTSPEYHHFLTPAQYGKRFGQSAAVYAQAVAWLKNAGFQVTTYPNRTFLEAVGTHAQVRSLLGVKLLGVAGQPGSVHRPDGALQLPAALKPVILHVSGLDTRVRYHHLLGSPPGPETFGPQDLRGFYGVAALQDAGFVCQGQKLMVLSTAEAPGQGASESDIAYFYGNISDATTVFQENVLPNAQNDFDPQPGAGTEFDLDAEMQSVGCPGADSITLEVAPASEVFTTGAEDIVNNFPFITSASVSLGNCEQVEQEVEQETGVNEQSVLQQAVQQGTFEGQTWFAASGDQGANDCQDGQTVSVDWPASIPEVVAMGGSQVNSPAWDDNGALLAYQQEVVWNGGAVGGAGGGGLSILYGLPTYQAAFGFTGRSVPDLSLVAGAPGVAEDSSLPGELDVVGGTSVASPLAAGFFALIASRVGCRLGDPHAVLYALGNAQRDGGAVVYNDITSGNNSIGGVTGFTAGPGYDSASGWGSLNVEALAAAWPPCQAPTPDAGPDAGPDLLFDGGATTGPSYNQCSVLNCADDAVCTTVPEGPSSCVVTCDPSDAGSCASGSVCSSQAFFSIDGGGTCVPGCLRDSDCGDAGVCSACEEVCVPPGNPSAKIGDACGSATDCPSGGSCVTSRGFDGGYCSLSCTSGSAEGSACGCPSGSTCVTISFSGAQDCIATCDTPGAPCQQRGGYICQPLTTGASCLPPCTVRSRGGTTIDSCAEWDPSLACDVDSGVCGTPTATADGGEDAGVVDAGPISGNDGGPVVVDAGLVKPGDAGIADAGAPDSGSPQVGTGTTGGLTPDAGTHPIDTSGCSCGLTGTPDVAVTLLGLLALPALRRRRKQQRSSR